MKILVVEDDRSAAELIKNRLTAHTVELAHDGADGSFLGRSFEYDTIVLDYSMPKKNGLQVCQDIRSAGRLTPILFLSATEDTETKIAALDAGADDYMTKPFSLDELSARINALHRRPPEMKKPIFRVGDLVLDAEKQIITRDDVRIRLTKKELNLLEYLMRNVGVVLSRAMIMEHVWTAESDLLSNTVEAHISNLRRKINIKSSPEIIANVPGRGYVIDTPENLKHFRLS